VLYNSVFFLASLKYHLNQAWLSLRLLFAQRTAETTVHHRIFSSKIIFLTDFHKSRFVAGCWIYFT
jgi:hypothetical protein